MIDGFHCAATPLNLGDHAVENAISQRVMYWHVVLCWVFDEVGTPSSPGFVRNSPAVGSDPAMSLEGAVGGAPPPVASTSFSETTSIMNELPPHMFGMSLFCSSCLCF